MRVSAFAFNSTRIAITRSSGNWSHRDELSPRSPWLPRNVTMKRSLLCLSLACVMLPALAAQPPAVGAAVSPSAAPGQPAAVSAAAPAVKVAPPANPAAPAPGPATLAPAAKKMEPSTATAATPPNTPVAGPATCLPCTEKAAQKPKVPKKKPAAKKVATTHAEPDEKEPTPYEVALKERQEQQAVRERIALANSWTQTANRGCAFLAPLYALPVAPAAKELRFSLPPTGQWKPARLVSSADWIALDLEDNTLAVSISENTLPTRRKADVSLESAGLHCSVPVLQEGTAGDSKKQAAHRDGEAAD